MHGAAAVDSADLAAIRQSSGCAPAATIIRSIKQECREFLQDLADGLLLDIHRRAKYEFPDISYRLRVCISSTKKLLRNIL